MCLLLRNYPGITSLENPCFIYVFREKTFSNLPSLVTSCQENRNVGYKSVSTVNACLQPTRAMGMSVLLILLASLAVGSVSSVKEQVYINLFKTQRCYRLL